MPDLTHWGTFFGAALVLLLMPGPSILYVVARGIAGGSRAAVLSSIGLALGDLLQVFASIIGLSAVLASAPATFAVLKLAGAGYLVVLEAVTLGGEGRLGCTNLQRNSERRFHSAQSLIAQGVLGLNPNTALFFLAFLPQFVARMLARRPPGCSSLE